MAPQGLPTLLLLVLTLMSTGDGSNQPRGHGQQLGKHRDSVGHIEILTTLPTPEEFWERYASRRQPVLFRGAATQSLGMHRWTDEYLLKHYGSLKVKIESKVEKEGAPSGAKGLGQDTIESFLSSYKSRNAYIISQLPQPMAGEVSVLPFLTCGTFCQRILEADLWMSSGGTKSLLHRDADNAVNCLYAGTKDWILIDPSFEDRIPIAQEDVVAYGGFALLNPDSVNLVKYPAFAEVEWSYANVTAGDCLFLPYGYWHQVRSYGSRNQAVSVLFSRLAEVDLSGCHDDDLVFTPLSEVGMVYTYDGYGDQTMGDTDPFELNETLAAWCQSSDVLDPETMLNELIEARVLDSDEIPNSIDPDNDQNLDPNIANKDLIPVFEATVKKMFKILDSNLDNRVDCKTELSRLSLSTLKSLANVLDGDSANTEKHEYINYTADQIRTLVMTCMHHADIHTNGELCLEDFLKSYLEFGGSRNGGQEVFDMLDEEGNGFISKDELHNNLEEVMQMFNQKMNAESSENLDWTREQQANRLLEDISSWEHHIHEEL